VSLPERRESLIASALADLAYYFARDSYSLIVNDLLAVRIVASQPKPHDIPDAYRIGPGAVTPLVNIQYPDHPLGTVLPHHVRSAARLAKTLGVPEALLAMACLTRDRLFSDSYPTFATPASR
jgi:hypothetical protein